MVAYYDPFSDAATEDEDPLALARGVRNLITLWAGVAILLWRVL